MSPLSFYEKRPPEHRNALDLFRDQWTTSVPGSDLGRVDLLNDDRVVRFLKHVGSLEGKTVLELGPLEGGHTKMLADAGADVLSIESNSQAYLRCLVLKEMLGYRAKFLLGNFVSFLAETDQRFDVVFASGVLYHMTDPVSVLRNILRVGDNIYLWTHYYDEEALSKKKAVKAHLGGKYETRDGFRLWLYDYNDTLDCDGFCGGPEAQSKWMEKEAIRQIISDNGFTVVYERDDPKSPNGPAFQLYLRR